MISLCYQVRPAEVRQMATQVPIAEINQPVGQQVTERVARFWPGIRMLVLGIVLIPAGVALLVAESHYSRGVADLLVTLGVLLLIASSLVLAGLTPVAPGRARVVQLFGRYRGTIRESGMQW